MQTIKSNAVHVSEEDEGGHVEAEGTAHAGQGAPEAAQEAPVGDVHSGPGPVLCGAPITIASSISPGQHLLASKTFESGDGGGVHHAVHMSANYLLPKSHNYGKLLCFISSTCQRYTARLLNERLSKATLFVSPVTAFKHKRCSAAHY